MSGRPKVELPVGVRPDDPMLLLVGEVAFERRHGRWERMRELPRWRRFFAWLGGLFG